MLEVSSLRGCLDVTDFCKYVVIALVLSSAATAAALLFISVLTLAYYYVSAHEKLMHLCYMTLC